MNLFLDLDTRVAAMRGLLEGVVSVEVGGSGAVDFALAAGAGGGAAAGGDDAWVVRDASEERAFCISTEDLPRVISKLDDEAVFRLTEIASQIGRLVEQVGLVASGVIGSRSTRAAGHSGLAQSRGHRTPIALIQQVAGISRNEAARQLRVGEALLEGAAPGGYGAEAGGPGAGDDGPGVGDGAALAGGVPIGGEPEAAGVLGDLGGLGDLGNSGAPGTSHDTGRFWHAPLGDALRSGALTSAQHDAIQQGLGEPPFASAEEGGSMLVPASECQSMPVPFSSELSSGAAAQPGPSASGAPAPSLNQQIASAWYLAAERLTAEAPLLTVEELAKQARAIRDLLDPEGAQSRFESRYEARSFKMWTDRLGLTHGKFVFDDESAEWIRSIIDSALRPRRGGPRFVDPKQQQAAKRLSDDPRTNDQLAHDLLVDVWKAGAVADAATVFGGRQAGLRIVQVVDREQYLSQATAPVAPVARLVESGTVLPSGPAAKHRCNTGTLPVTADREGNPLDVGREQRLYTSKQRIALALRDGGCRWTGCDRPASYCEAHHIDHWEADQGRTDIDRGILLCSFHHMQLHNRGWKITREATGPFVLHPPPDKSATSEARAIEGQCTVAGRPPDALEKPDQLNEPIELRPPLPLSYSWQTAIPPDKRFMTAA